MRQGRASFFPRQATGIFSTVRFYHPKVIEHYQNPRNVGTMDKNLPNVGTGLVGAPACGDVMRLQIKVNDNTGVIEDVKFKTFGCGSICYCIILICYGIGQRYDTR